MSEHRFRWSPPDPGPSPREPLGVCYVCGAQGTVARATRAPVLSGENLAEWRARVEREGREVRRYCEQCWLGVRVQLEEEGVWACDSQSWSNVEEFLGLIATVPPGDPALTREMLEALAAEIVATAPEIDGAMPPSVASFIQAYGSPAA